MTAKRDKIKSSQLEGFKYFKAISKMLEGLHDAGCKRDIAGNRILGNFYQLRLEQKTYCNQGEDKKAERF